MQMAYSKKVLDNLDLPFDNKLIEDIKKNMND
jgi:hypothetical protein